MGSSGTEIADMGQLEEQPRERRTVTVGLVQINNSFSGQNYLPYSVACLESHAKRHAADPGRLRFLTPIYKRQPIREVVEHLLAADLAGFSVYVWNSRISLEAARRLKARRPETVIVFGGPQVPDEPEAFLRRHPFIDLVVHNEGEQTFTALLDSFPGRDWGAIDGVSFVNAAGEFIKTPPRQRMRDLDGLPSPFLTGAFDALIAANPDEAWIGLWETNRGCPFKCTFCDWGSSTAAKVNKFEDDRLMRELDWFAARKIEYLFVCDANFGSQKRDLEIARYVADTRARTGYPHSFSVQNTKNATERAYQTQKILSDAGLNKGVALSMQSLDPTTLANIKRENISLETYLELARRFMADRVETYSDLIIGLPGETYDSFCEGVDTLISSGQHNRIQFNNLSILPNAEMGSAEYLATFGMVTVETEIINIHGRRELLDDDVPENQILVVATDSMPADDWRRTRAFSWMAALLHFDKLFQIPLVIAHELTGARYRDLLEGFMAAGADRHPIIAGIRDFFLEEARSIQNGGSEYVHSAQWLDIYWPADEYVFIKLTAENKINAFYAEAVDLLMGVIRPANERDGEIIRHAALLNGRLLRRPVKADDMVVETPCDIMGFYRGVLVGEHRPMNMTPSRVLVERSKDDHEDFQKWCREVVWWGNKKGAYLYNSRNFEPQLAGHY